jgi:hypothetical protein
VPVVVAIALAVDGQHPGLVLERGLDRIHKARGILSCYDLSATPFVPTGKQSSEESLFSWIVSDFGLNDAIESGLVKTPRVVVLEVNPSLTNDRKGGELRSLQPCFRRALARYRFRAPLRPLAELFSAPQFQWNLRRLSAPAWGFSREPAPGANRVLPDGVPDYVAGEPDATPDEVAEGVVRGMNFRYVTGQSCNSTSRVYLHESIHDATLPAEAPLWVPESRLNWPTEPLTARVRRCHSEPGSVRVRVDPLRRPVDMICR